MILDTCLKKILLANFSLFLYIQCCEVDSVEILNQPLGNEEESRHLSSLLLSKSVVYT